jgi:hypothetical protein
MSVQKNQVVNALKNALVAAHLRAKSEWDELASSLTKETKSTAGDKHETGRAMVHLEMEQAGQRLARMEAMMSAFQRLELNSERTTIGPGALVLVEGGGFFLGVPFGGFDVPEWGKLQAISSDAPLALAMMGHGAGSEVVFRERSWRIVQVV